MPLPRSVPLIRPTSKHEARMAKRSAYFWSMAALKLTAYAAAIATAIIVFYGYHDILTYLGYGEQYLATQDDYTMYAILSIMFWGLIYFVDWSHLKDMNINTLAIPYKTLAVVVFITIFWMMIHPDVYVVDTIVFSKNIILLVAILMGSVYVFRIRDALRQKFK